MTCDKKTEPVKRLYYRLTVEKLDKGGFLVTYRPTQECGYPTEFLLACTTIEEALKFVKIELTRIK